MANLPKPELTFDGAATDCGRREISLPLPLPEVGDDFDWQLRDYDSFRLFMFEELAARFPERRRWTPADIEVVLVEALAAMLDQLSDMADRVAAEAYLETARRPETVYRLLKLIGYDAVQESGHPQNIKDLLSAWAANPEQMEAARLAGPRNVHRQRRMVTAEDYARRLEEHPLMLRANAWQTWGGAWPILWITVTLWNDAKLDDPTPEEPQVQASIASFHGRRGLPNPDGQTIRSILDSYLQTYRMAGQQVVLQDALPVGIDMEIDVVVKSNYYGSEVRQIAEQSLGRGPGGFFEPGRLRLGEDVHVGDIYQVLTAIAGVDRVSVDRFKRHGSLYEDQATSGRIRLDRDEIAVCDNDPRRPARGLFHLDITGGRKG